MTRVPSQSIFDFGTLARSSFSLILHKAAEECQEERIIISSENGKEKKIIKKEGRKRKKKRKKERKKGMFKDEVISL